MHGVILSSNQASINVVADNRAIAHLKAFQGARIDQRAKCGAIVGARLQVTTVI